MATCSWPRSLPAGGRLCRRQEKVGGVARRQVRGERGVHEGMGQAASLERYRGLPGKRGKPFIAFRGFRYDEVRISHERSFADICG